LKSHYRVRAETSSEVKVPILFIYGSVDPWAVDNAPLMYESANSPKFIVNVDSLDHSAILKESIPFKYIISFLKVYLNGDEDYIPHLYGKYAQQDVEEGLIKLTYDISEFSVESQEPVEVETTEVSETEAESEPSGGIPGYPTLSMGIALLLVSLILYYKQR